MRLPPPHTGSATPRLLQVSQSNAEAMLEIPGNEENSADLLDAFFNGLAGHPFTCSLQAIDG